MRSLTATVVRPLLLAVLLPASLAWLPAWAQNTVIQAENVRMDYAQVLRVEPVYQTLRASRQEQQCDGEAVPPKDPPHGLSRIVGAVKGALGRDDEDKAPAGDDGDCQVVTVDREFRRPIAFDVDYVYKGMKYRSRLPRDPGNRLKIRVSVTPYMPAASN